MLKYLVLLFALSSTVFAQTPNLQTCEGLFEFLKPFEIVEGSGETFPQVRQIQVSGLVKALDIINPNNTFEPVSLMLGIDLPPVHWFFVTFGAIIQLWFDSFHETTSVD
jgi:hypothetical protein